MHLSYDSDQHTGIWTLDSSNIQDFIQYAVKESHSEVLLDLYSRCHLDASVLEPLIQGKAYPSLDSEARPIWTEGILPWCYSMDQSIYKSVMHPVTLTIVYGKEYYALCEHAILHHDTEAMRHFREKDLVRSWKYLAKLNFTQGFTGFEAKKYPAVHERSRDFIDSFAHIMKEKDVRKWYQGEVLNSIFYLTVSSLFDFPHVSADMFEAFQSVFISEKDYRGLYHILKKQYYEASLATKAIDTLQDLICTSVTRNRVQRYLGEKSEFWTTPFLEKIYELQHPVYSWQATEILLERDALPLKTVQSLMQSAEQWNICSPDAFWTNPKSSHINKHTAAWKQSIWETAYASFTRLLQAQAANTTSENCEFESVHTYHL